MKGYRKFGFAILVVLSALTGLLTRFLTGAEFVSLVSTATVAYLAMNAAQAVGSKLAEKKQVEVKLTDIDPNRAK